MGLGGIKIEFLYPAAVGERPLAQLRQTALCAMKASALRGRVKEKDSYDIVWLLNELGPENAAAEAVGLAGADREVWGEVKTTADALAEDFAIGRSGPAWYANFFAGSDDRDLAQLEREATDVVGTWASLVLTGCEALAS